MRSLKNVVILTAVAREYEKIRERLSGDGEERMYDGNRYEIFQHSFGNSTVNVVIGMTQQGNSEAATRTSHAILTFKPILIVFAGTCGAIKDARIGDIVVATREYDLLRGKEQTIFSSKPVSKEISPHIRSIGDSLASKVKRGVLRKDLFLDNAASVILAPVGSSAVIVADDNAKLKQLIKERFADVIAVELEGYGFYTAAYENAQNNAVVVRGVTDNSSDKNDSTDNEIQPKIMERVSIFVFEFIQAFLENNLPNSKAVKNYNTVIDFFPAESNSKNIKSSLNAKNVVFCGFLSFGLQTIEQKTHLGHCYFIHLIDKLLEAHDVTLFLCTTSQNFVNMSTKKYSEYTSILNDTIKRWKECFAGKARILDIREYLKTKYVQDQEFLQKFNAYYTEIKNKFRRLNNVLFMKMLNSLEEWRKTEVLDGTTYKILEDCLNVHPSDMTLLEQREVISMAYIMVKRPTWFTPEWLAEFLMFWKYGAPHIALDRGNGSAHKDMILIESLRNLYVWNAASFCSKKIEGQQMFTHRLYFKNVPNLTLQGYMKTSETEYAVFLRDFDYNAIYRTNPKFIKIISELFHLDAGNNELSQKECVETLVCHYKNRLGIS
jgi:nucleoside phosphorylase